MNQKTVKLTPRQKFVIGKLPCTGKEIPVSYRGELRKLEDAGLIVCAGSPSYIWNLTGKENA